MARLLVVDDERDICDLVVKRLRRQGHEVLSAGCGSTALSVVQLQGMPDAVILDVVMPGMDGFDLLDRLREQRPDLPALLLTVLWQTDIHARMRAAGVTYVAKPFTAASLMAGVEQLLHSVRESSVPPRSDP